MSNTPPANVPQATYAFRSVCDRLPVGGHWLGYFLPHEGSNYEAQANFAFTQCERFILKEERTFPQPVPARYLLVCQQRGRHPY